MSKICPLCGGSNCNSYVDSQDDSIRYVCNVFNRTVRIAGPFHVQDESQFRRLGNLVFEHVIRFPFYGEYTYWWFYYEPSYRTQDTDAPFRINLAEMKYPQTISEKVDRILMNLYHINSEFGYVFNLDQQMARAFFSETEREDKTFGFAGVMKELGYLNDYIGNACAISAKGWQRIEDIQKNNLNKKQGFIAMEFRDETKTIRECFHQAMQNCGYTALAIDEKEHNNQIVPEIFYEIDNSRFLVMDVTYPNCGAYYEAGYALGKGKQVIICCRKDAFDNTKEKRPHFDIQQKSMIIWETEAELIERLEKRIKATVK